MVHERSAREASHRVEGLLAEVASAPTVERAQEKAEDLVRALVGLYGDGLERILEIVHEAAGERSAAVFEALCADPFTESLLVLHDLHPLSLEERVGAALESVRPYLASHEGGVELVSVADGVVVVRLEGSCDGCHASAPTLKGAVERAILERIPEIREVVAEGAPPAANSLRLQSDWVTLGELPSLEREGVARLTLAGMPLLLVRAGETIFAYRDRCPRCKDAFEDATFAQPYVRCAGCGRGYDVVRAGREEDGGELFAEPFALVRENGRVRVAIPLGL